MADSDLIRIGRKVVRTLGSSVVRQASVRRSPQERREGGDEFTALHAAYESYNTAVSCSRQDRDCVAVSYYLAAIELRPGFPEAIQNLGIIYSNSCEDKTLGIYMKADLQKALHYHRLAVEHALDLEFRVGALGNLYVLEMRLEGGKEKSKLQQMAQNLHETLQKMPQPWPEPAHFTLGVLYSESGQEDVGYRVHQDVLANYPNHATALLNLGNYHFKRDQFDSARRLYNQAAVALQGDSTQFLNRAMLLCNIGQCYREQQSLLGAENAFVDLVQFLDTPPFEVSQSMVRNPYRLGLQLFAMANLYAIKTLTCSWNDFEQLEGQISSSITDMITHPDLYSSEGIGLGGMVDPYTLTLHRFADFSMDKGNTIRVCKDSLKYSYRGSKQLVLQEPRPLRVGYLSQDWRNHPMGRLTMRLVTAFQSGKVAPTCLSYGARDNSIIRRYVEENSYQFYDILDIKVDQDAVAFIERLDLDILVDLTSHTYRGRIAIAAHSPAPIVINYLGYPGTTGCDGYDYSVVDRLSVPAEYARPQFTEKLVYLPHIYQANFMPAGVSPCLASDRRKCRERMLPDQVLPLSSQWSEPSTTRLLLDSSRYWMCSFNANKKMEPLALQTWMQLLVESPRALLILSDTDNLAKKSLLQNAKLHGVAPHRLVFIRNLPWKNHLYRTSACDLILDTFTYGAHTTASDALWMWVPVLSLEGWGSQRMPSRIASAISKSLLGEGSVLPVLQSARQYQDVGSRLCRKIKTSHVLHDRIGRAGLQGATFNHELHQKVVESAYQSISEVRMLENRRDTAANSKRYHVLAGLTSHASYEEEMSELRVALVSSLNACLGSSGNCRGSAIAATAGRLLISFPINPSRERLIGVLKKHNLEIAAAEDFGKGCQEDFVSWLETGEFQDSIEEGGLMVQTCLPVVQLELVQLWLIWQKRAPCEQELAVFDILQVFLLNSSRKWDPQNSTKYINAKIISMLFKFLPFLAGNDASKITEPSLFMAWHFSKVVQQSTIRGIMAEILTNHAVCLLEKPEKIKDSLTMFLSSLLSDPSPDGLKNLGLALQNKNSNDGFVVVSQAALLMHDKRRVDFYESKGIPVDPFETFDWPASQNKQSIAIYCYEYGNEYWGRWGPSSLEPGGGGLGGSEEAVVYMSEELARRGYRVTVYADPSDEDLSKGLIRGVRWRSYAEYDRAYGWMNAPDVFISWRYGVSLDIGLNAPKQLLWLQDLIPASSIPPPGVLSLRSIMVLGKFHQDKLVPHLRSLGYSEEAAQAIPVIVPNGIDVRHEIDNKGENKATHFAYGSSPIRGLEAILRFWPLIRAGIPDATLAVYYGFPPTVAEQLEKSMGSGKYESWRREMDKLLNQTGITYYGAVDHTMLAKGYAKAGFLLYPTFFPETGCITVQKAMVAGAIPITSRYSESVLPVLTAGWDMGPQEALTPGRDYTVWMKEQWVPAVVAAASLPGEQLVEVRERMRSTIQEQYSWASAATKLEAIF